MCARFRRMAVLVWAAASLVPCQYTSQEIAGFVRDPSGAVVPAVQISVRHLETGQTRIASVGGNGYFVVVNLPIGHYEIQAEAPGFKKFVQKNLVIDVGTKLTVDISLEVGALADSITVTAGASQVEASTGEVGRLVSGTEATRLQLNGRNFAQLLTLVPGVSSTNRSSFGLLGAYGAMGAAQSINGSRNYTFSWNIDGADNKDNGGGGNQFVNINPDALAEFKVMTANYNAEYGQNAGAVINLALKSGTQAFHGSAYEYVRNDAFDARAFNAPSKQKLRFNNFGWNLGGPIYIPNKFNSDKSKLFFFVGQEYKRLRQGNVNTWVVPAPGPRDGNFSSLSPAQWPVDVTNKAVFPKGIIPASRFSRNSKRLIDNYPLPNFAGPGGNFVFMTTSAIETNQYIHKADYLINSRHQLAFHYLYDHYSAPQNLGALVTFQRNIPGINSSAKWMFMISPTSVNTFQFTFSGNRLEQVNFTPNPLFIRDFTRKAQGIDFPAIYGMAEEIPTVRVAGYNNLSAAARDYNNYNRIFQWKDDLSKVAGAHNLKFGVLVMRSRKNQDNVPPINGLFIFSTGHMLSSGNALADALLGNFAQYSEADTNREGWFRFTQAEFYGQDNWKVSRRLSLDFGLRYQYMQPQYSALRNVVAFSPRHYDPAKAVTLLRANGEIVPGSGDVYNGLVLGGSGFPAAAKARIPGIDSPEVQKLFRGLPKEIARTDWATAGPRAGFAFDLTGRQRTVLRGGAGLFYERVQGGYVIGRVNNPPFIRQSDIYSGNVENPAGGSKPRFPSAISSADLDVKVPRVANWSLGVQHKIGEDTLLDAAYVGSSGWNQFRAVDLNQLPEGTIQTNTGVNTNALRPYLGFASITHLITGSNSNYNALQVLIKTRMKDGGLVNLSYTWSKAITDASTFNDFPMDSYHFKRDRGLSDFDRRHMFVLSYVYPLPFWRAGHVWYHKAFGGWQLSGVTSLQRGRPLNIVISGDRAGIGRMGQRPDVIGDWQAGTTKTRLQWFNTAAFRQPALGTFGNLGRNVVIGPGIVNWDASLQKTFHLSERVQLQFRWEVYNAPHHFSYWDVATTVGAANFGQVTSASDPRTLQFGLRLEF